LPPHISQDPIWGLQAGDSYSYEVWVAHYSHLPILVCHFSKLQWSKKISRRPCLRGAKYCHQPHLQFLCGFKDHVS
jgi:hypothetical protein